jgi:cytochrome c oxidase subunit 3
MIAIESTVFLLLFVSYIYLRDRALDWPPTPFSRQQYILSTCATVALLVSTLPMYLSSLAARRGSLRGMRVTLCIGLLLGAAFWGLRYYELLILPFRWDTHAHGSLFWTISVMHMTHVLTSGLETVLMLLVLFAGPVEEKQLVDIQVNSLYWYFVVLSGLATYAILYLDPLVLSR